MSDRMTTTEALDDLIDRLDRAADSLAGLAAAPLSLSRVAHLMSKREGVLLAKGYVRELRAATREDA